MSQHNLKNSPVPIGLSKAHVTPGSEARSLADIAVPLEYQSVENLDIALLLHGAPYTQEYLDSLTINDKVFSLKQLNDDANYGLV